MSDKDRDPMDLESPRKNVEPDPGKGRRSLAQWQNLARVRQSLAADKGAQEQYRLNPVSYMQRHGLDMAGALPGQATEGGLRLGIEATSESAEAQLAFCKVWGCVIVVAGAVANAAVMANAGANANAAANANLTANVNGMDVAGPFVEGQRQQDVDRDIKNNGEVTPPYINQPDIDDL